MEGRKLGHYELIRLLGRGGMGEVYLARDPRLGREVALKVLPAEFATQPERRVRFLREAQAISSLSHPNICTIHDIGAADGHDYICFEYLEGKTLEEVIGGTGLPRDRLLDLALPLAEALDYAHRKGVVHRDLKPANVIVTDLGIAKLLDFGLAKVTGAPPGKSQFETATKISHAGTILGTFAYMSPEQALGKDVDARSDIFSFGAMLYQMATGRVPFTGATATEVVDAVLHGDPPPLLRLRPELPEEFARVVDQALRKDPAERYQHMADVAAHLRHLRRESGASGQSRITSGPARSVSGKRRAAGHATGMRRWAVPVAIGLGLAALVATLVGMNVGGVRSWFGGRPAGGRIDSLAVLPLENLSGDPDQEYFADGMTEALIASLAKIGPLRVISRTSVMQYKGARKPLPQIARELGVDAVVEGSVLRSNDRVRITAQLVDAASDRHLWAESYERDLRDVLGLQSEVARAIAEQIRVTLSPAAEGRLAHNARPISPAAHEAYLKGRFHWNKRTPEDLRKAADYFQTAIREDPTYAPAYAGLAETYALFADYGVEPPAEAFPKAREAALKAIAIDDTMPEGHTALGYAKLGHDWDWSGAETEFRRALEIDPNYATAHQWYGEMLGYTARYEEAIAALERARDLDPLSPIISLNLGRTYEVASRPEAAIEQYRRTIEMHPDFALARNELGRVYVSNGKIKEGLAEMEAARRLGLDLGDYAYGLALSGDRVGALRVVREIREKTAGAVGVLEALVHAGLGDTDAMFSALERACSGHAPGCLSLKVEPRFAPWRSDPRFVALLARIGLPPG